MKLLMIAVACVALLTGCDRATTQIEGNYTLPDGLRDCKIYRLDPGGLSPRKILYVLRCPNSTTSVTTQNGKTMQKSTTQEGN